MLVNSTPSSELVGDENAVVGPAMLCADMVGIRKRGVKKRKRRHSNTGKSAEACFGIELHSMSFADPPDGRAPVPSRKWSPGPTFRSPTGTTSHSEIMRGLVGQPSRVVSPSWAPVLCRGRPTAPPFLRVSLAGRSIHDTHAMPRLQHRWSHNCCTNVPACLNRLCSADLGTRSDENRIT